MKKIAYLGTALFALTITSKAETLSTIDNAAIMINAGDTTVQVLFYNSSPRDGMHLAYLNDDEQWTELGQVFSSDYGQWGSEKRMYNPYVERALDGTWRAVWSVNKYAPCFAAAYGFDLVTWRTQDYPVVSVKGIDKPIVFPMDGGKCDIYFKSEKGKRYVSSDESFRHFSQDEPSTIGDEAWLADTATVNGKHVEGHAFEINVGELRKAISFFNNQRAQNKLNAERMSSKEQLAPQTVTLSINQNAQKSISDKLVGIFFEDISYAADGGLYAELIQNRDFEYTAADHAGWTATTSWTSDKPIKILTENPLSANNPHYAVLSGETSLINGGWDGISDKGAAYNFSFYARNIDCKKKKLTVALVAEDGTVLAEANIKTEGNGWHKYEAQLNTMGKKRAADAAPQNVKLCLMAHKDGNVAVDMISLFPAETFKGRPNGMRKDLAEALAALHPKFMRFPGGCMSHGQGIDNIYHWNETIGALQDRKPAMNIWNYHQTRGLGFYEYFQFCEDLGCEPLPVLAAGVPCQNSAANALGIGGQQNGIPMKDMKAYCDEICDLVEWANGDPATSKWAKMRADAGHPAPFNLHYLGIGNEDLMSTVFEERCKMIAEAVHAKYPDIKIVGTAGPFHAPSSDYVEGWKFAKANKDLFYSLDEHYYESVGWFINNQHYYDAYDRHAPKVYLGEYAAKMGHTPTIETALAEALHLANVERNADVVTMTSYAPLLCKKGHANWNPDMIYFDNNRVITTPAYETQRLFSIHSGDKYIGSTISGTIPNGMAKRVAASVVSDSKTGKSYLKIVNTLPSQLTLNISGMNIPVGTKLIGYAGKPEDTKATIQTIATTSANQIVVPAFSLFVAEL